MIPKKVSWSITTQVGDRGEYILGQNRERRRDHSRAEESGTGWSSEIFIKKGRSRERPGRAESPGGKDTSGSTESRGAKFGAWVWPRQNFMVIYKGWSGAYESWSSPVEGLINDYGTFFKAATNANARPSPVPQG